MAQRTENLADLLQLSQAEYEEMLRAAVDCYGEAQLNQAEMILIGLIALRGNDPRPVKLLASCLMLQDRHREAESMFERACELDGGDPYALVALGEIKLKAFKLDEAIPVFEKLFSLDPDGRHPAANRGRQLVRAYHAKLTEMK